MFLSVIPVYQRFQEMQEDFLEQFSDKEKAPEKGP